MGAPIDEAVLLLGVFIMVLVCVMLAWLLVDKIWPGG